MTSIVRGALKAIKEKGVVNFLGDFKDEGYLKCLSDGNILQTKIHNIGATLVGVDKFGNKYYQKLEDTQYGRHRWVEYADKGRYNASQVPAEWHGWLHFITDHTGDEMIMEGARVHLKGWQQAAVAAGSALGALMDPRRADLIAALGETTGKPAFYRVLERMKNSTQGRVVLLERPRVISSNVSHAWDLPENTFGAAYSKFMGSRNFSPDDRPPVRFMETEELAYVATRAREVHDFWHVLFNLPTNLLGESALKVIEFEQMLHPMCLMSVVGGAARFNEKQRSLFFKHYFPWATRAGMRCTDLISVYYEKHFHENLEDVRKKWGIIPCPDPNVTD